MQVIGLTGFAEVGKSTVAGYLVKEHGFTRLSFAAPLKKMLRQLNPIMGASLASTGSVYQRANRARAVHLAEVFRVHGEDELAVKASKYGAEYRRLLQSLGTDCIRAFDEHFWVNAALAQMTDKDASYVFDDCRFPNEAQVIKDLNLYGLWNVTRPGFEPTNGHISEQHAGKMGEKVWLHNGYGLQELQDQIDVSLDFAFGGVPA